MHLVEGLRFRAHISEEPPSEERTFVKYHRAHIRKVAHTETSRAAIPTCDLPWTWQIVVEVNVVETNGFSRIGLPYSPTERERGNMVRGLSVGLYGLAGLETNGFPNGLGNQRY